MLALIDSDILVYRVGFTTESDPEWVAAARIDESIGKILATLKTDKYKCFLTSQEKNNFRYEIYPEYKANRKQPKPRHFAYIREYLCSAYKAYIAEGEEADDRLGIEACSNPDAVVVSLDKDLDQIPGDHYNWVRNERYHITPEQGLWWFYHQLLTGDKAVDNIPGINGIGPKKADAALRSYTSEPQLFKVVSEIYRRHYPDSWESIMLRNGQLLKIRTKEGEIWQFPNLESNTDTDQDLSCSSEPNLKSLESSQDMK